MLMQDKPLSVYPTTSPSSPANYILSIILRHILQCRANGQLAGNLCCQPFILAANKVETPLFYRMNCSLMISHGIRLIPAIFKMGLAARQEIGFIN